MENKYKFDLPKHKKSIIKVIGVGGGGSNAVNHMFNQGIKDVEFVVCNTDAQALNSSPVPNKLQIGINLTNGLGAGANPERGKNAALESKDEIRTLLEDNTKMVFVTAGMGGGTGTGAAPVLAKIAKDMDILTVGIVTAPFAFEGKKKMAQAELGIKELKENCDTVLVILNDKLREIYGNLSISDAFAQADNILTTAAKGIAEIITVPGYVNVDFEDVRTVMYKSGAAVMGSAMADGENRARRAAEHAISSPLLNNQDINGAQKILLSITSGEQAELQMDELSEITEFIQEMAGPDAEVIFGHGIDAGLGNNISVTVIATGFDDSYTKPIVKEGKKVFDLESTRQIPLFDARKDGPLPKIIEPLLQSSVEEEKDEIESEEQVTDLEIDENQIKMDLEIEEEIELEDENETTLEDEAEEDESKELVEVPNIPQEEKEFDRGFFFEKRVVEEEEDEAGLFEDEEIFKIDETAEEELNEEGILELKAKKEFLQKQAKERVEKLRGISGHDLDTDAFKEKLDVPAYLRKKIIFEKVPHSSESNISRYNLNDENQILGNNRFLHDNVD